jgi:hypothetical protein
MPVVVCWELDCLHNIDGRCRAAEIEYDPADGCLTMEPRLQLDDVEDEEENWDSEGMRLLDED